jgi:hypothetical protein
MKEFLTSFLSSTISNRNGKLSISNRQTQKLSTGFIAVVLLVASFFLASTNISFAQSAIPGTASISTVVADPAGGEWKTPVEYSAVLTAMKASTQKILTDPNSPPSEHTLYTGFNRLLSYMQADMEAHLDISKIAEKNYNQVVLEAATDPVLINMSMSDFASLYNSLDEKLHQ